MKNRQPSLKTRLVTRQLALQFLAVAAAAAGMIIFFIESTVDGMYADEAIVKIAANAINRDAAGHPVVTVTPDLAELRKEVPDLWFAARLSDGTEISYGKVPTEFAPLVHHLDKLSSADMRGQFPPYSLSSIMRKETGPAGDLNIIAHGRVQPFSALIGLASNIIAIVIFLTLAVISVIATPMIVKRALAGVITTAQEAEKIDAERRGIRLSEDLVPREIWPLVRAVNDALGRLDYDYDRQHRFIASAAHELRTPIAILRMKIDASTDKGIRSLSPDVSRLSNIAEQLLDLHRLDNGALDDRIDLAELARNVAADMAPMLIATNKTIEVVVAGRGMIVGNAGSIERALTNLIQNAVDHGGDTIVIRIGGTSLEVEDDGQGVPPEEFERVFEPFHRLRQRSSGTGLGLNLVKQVVDHHHGRITMRKAAGGGAIVQIEFASAS